MPPGGAPATCIRCCRRPWNGTGQTPATLPLVARADHLQPFGERHHHLFPYPIHNARVLERALVECRDHRDRRAKVALDRLRQRPQISQETGLLVAGAITILALAAWALPIASTA